LKPWLKKQWVIPTVGADFVWRMEDVLDLYAEPYDPARPVVCFDETSKQLIAETRVPLPMEPGKPERVDYEYERRGTANLFLVTQPLGAWRHVDVTDRRTKHDFAHQMRDLVDRHFPDADRIRVVLDNLNTHTPAALYEAFPPAEAGRIRRKLELHYTPVHGSWLNLAELEFSMLSRQCLDRRIGDRDTLVAEVAAWQAARNEQRATIRWQFTVDDARRKLHRLYPS
jgi:DDE superfamily endonuclease